MTHSLHWPRRALLNDAGMERAQLILDLSLSIAISNVRASLFAELVAVHVHRLVGHRKIDDRYHWISLRSSPRILIFSSVGS